MKHWCRPFAARLLAAAVICLSLSTLVHAQPPAPGLCDPGATDCRKFLLDYINKETTAIDVAFWFMEDARYTSALVAAANRGVKIRVIVDPRANETNRFNADRLAELQNAGLPMRKRIASGILHWKTMIFASQGVVEFSGANYSADAWRPADPNQPFGNYTDESIYFSSTTSIFRSFQSKFDDLWTDTVSYANYANITPPLERFWGPPVTKDPELNFPPGESYASRAIARYKAEVPSSPTPGAIDVIMYRITDNRHADQMIAAVQRGVPVRLITEPQQYRDETRLWHSYNIDRMYMGGVAIRQRTHAGLNHQKSILLKGQRMVIFGSSNWSTASDNSQQEHNYFTTRPELFSWFVDQFERKWNNPAENGDFVPLPPDNPVNKAPLNNATAQPTTVTLQWFGGPWAHKYDVYLGTTPNPPLVAADLALGPSESATELQSFTPNTPLLPGTTYYWRVVSKTMANLTGTGPVHSFTTAGQAPPPSVNGTLGPGDILLYASKASAKAGAFNTISDGTAANGLAMWQPDAGVAKIATPAASPTHYFELTFTPEANRPYHVWMRAKADRDNWANDSIFMQFSNSVSASGAAIYRIGTTSANILSIEDCSGCGVHGWGWQDNAYGANTFGPAIIFNSSAPQTLRVQAREDGIRIDQILLSPQTFVTTSPGALKDDTTIYPEVTSPGPPASATLVRAPYLQQVGPDRATIVWTTREPGPASVTYATGSAAPTTVSAVSTLFPTSRTGMAADYYQHVASLTGLAPSTTYQYHVIVQGTDLNPASDRLVTAPANGSGTVKFVALADSGTGSTEQRQLATLLRGETFDLMLHGGDIAYGEAAGEGDGSYQTLDDWFFSIYAPTLRSHPVFPSMGNHDVRASNNNGQHYLDAFVLPTNGASATFPDHAERYYSFDYGPMHVVVLDTELAFQSDTARRQAQLAWADADLASTTQPWKVALFHRSPYSSGGEHGSDVEVRNAFGPIFEQRGVQLVISGHEHDYERTVPINVSNPSGPGVTYIVTGGGGAPLYPNGTGTWTAYSESRHQYLRGTADPCVLEVEAIGLDSSMFDSVTLTQCTPADTEKPTASIDAPANGSTVSGIVEVDVTAMDNVGVSGTELLIDNTVNATDGEDPFQFLVDTRLLTNGGHTFRVRAYDAAGNVGLSTPLTITVANTAPDTVAPTASITSPADGSTVGDSTLVSVTAADNVAVTRVEMWADGVLAATDATAPFSFTIGSLSLSAATHTLQAKAYDAAGNIGASSVIGVTVDRSAPPASDIVLYASEAPVRVGSWTNVADATAAGGTRIRNPNASRAKIVTASASPASYFEMTFNANAGQGYHLWMRGKADSNSYANDSVFVQFDGSVDANGSPINRIGTTSAAEYNLEDCSGCGVANWGWQDNGYTTLGPDLFFATTGPQRLRIQVREDGLSIDQIVLSPSTYLTVAPGPLKNDTTILPKSGGGTPADTTAPTTSITSPANGDQVSGTVAINAAASDNVGVTHVDLYVDGSLTATTTAAPYSFSWNSSGSASGTHTLQTRAFDAANNSGMSAIVNVTVSTPVDTTAPSAAIASPADGSTVSSGSTVSVTASDDVGVSRVELWVDGAGSATDTSSPYGFTLGTLTPGPHTLQARAYDAANNVGTSATINITITSAPSDIVLYASEAPLRVGNWTIVADATAAGGSRLRNPNAGGAKIVTASASPANYVELTFQAQADVPYHLWIRGKADSNSYANDSVFVQFSDATDGSGATIYGIGTTSATEYNLEDCSGCGVASWGWQDNGYAGMGLNITFATSGTHTMRIQTREDGLSIDQIVLSPSRFLTASPGALKNDTVIVPKQ